MLIELANRLLDYLPEMRKALVPYVVGLGLVALGYLGITEDMTVKEALTLLVTSGLVWVTKNANKKTKYVK